MGRVTQNQLTAMFVEYTKEKLKVFAPGTVTAKRPQGLKDRGFEVSTRKTITGLVTKWDSNKGNFTGK